MTVDDALGVIQQAARGQAPDHDPSDDAALDAAVRTIILVELPLLWQRFLPFVQAVLDRRSDGYGVERVVGALFRACGERHEAEVDPLVAEPRLVDLAARLRHHDSVGAAARSVLAAVPRDRGVAAVERYPHDPVQPRVAPPEHCDFLARYLAGERGVWNELVEQAIAIGQHAELRAEAHAVAVELMKRVRHNADAVRATLREAGAPVADEAAPATDADLVRLDAMFGPLPLALDAFWRVVGSISLLPTAPAHSEEGIALAALDPLVVCGVGEVGAALDAYELRIAASHREIVGPLALEVAPHFARKHGGGDGAPTTIDLPPPAPADSVDPRVHHARHRLRFVEYLRHSFRWGGFAVLDIARRPIEHVAPAERLAFARVAGDWGEAANRLAARLRANLVDF